MTTFRRTTEVVPSGHGVQGYAEFNVGTPLSEGKTAFRPVSPATLLEIMGYVTAGLSDMGVSDDEAAVRIYTWHTWLRRMNAWMRTNETRYLEIMRLPEPTASLPKNEFFLGAFGTLTSQSNNAETAALGPLLPGDKGTFTNALAKGVAKTAGAGKRTEKALTQFVQDVDKLAAYLAPSSNVSVPAGRSDMAYQVNGNVVVQPQNANIVPGSVIAFPTNPIPNSVISSLPPSTATFTTQTIATPGSIDPVTRLFVTPSAVAPAVQAQSPLTVLLANAVDYARILVDRIKALPMWAHVLLLMIVFAIAAKGSLSSSLRSTRVMVAMVPNTGAISKFSIPPVDPFI